MKAEAPETENERKMQALDSLARILKNGLATASDRQRRLIQYLATEELEGRGDRLKAISIATEVLGRSADFDPQTDSIVRVEMGRMRKALDLYYATLGASDPVQIKFEKGSYRPKFEWISKAQSIKFEKGSYRPKFEWISKAQSAQRRWRLWVILTAVLVAVFGGGAFWFLFPSAKILAERPTSPVAIAGS